MAANPGLRQPIKWQRARVRRRIAISMGVTALVFVSLCVYHLCGYPNSRRTSLVGKPTVHPELASVEVLVTSRSTGSPIIGAQIFAFDSTASREVGASGMSLGDGAGESDATGHASILVDSG